MGVRTSHTQFTYPRCVLRPPHNVTLAHTTFASTLHLVTTCILCRAALWSKPPDKTRNFQKFSPGPRSRSNQKTMATLKDLLSAHTDICDKIERDLRKAVKGNTTPNYAPNMSKQTREALMKFVAEYNAKLTRSDWATLNDLCATEQVVIVYIEGHRVGIETSAKSVEFGKHLGRAMKMGKKLFWVNKGREISWDNWTTVYAGVTPVPKRKRAEAHEYDPEMSEREMNELLTERKRQRHFHAIAKPLGSRKGDKIRPEDAVPYVFRKEYVSFETKAEQERRMARIDRDSRVIRQARKIFEAI